MQKNYTLIDGNSIGFQSHQAGVKLYAGKQETQGVFNFLKSIRQIHIERQHSECIVLWDGRSWRKDVLSDYKAQRSATKSLQKQRVAYKSQRPFMSRSLKSLGVPQAIAGNLEADDLAAFLSIMKVGRGHKVRLITRDRDWQQLVRKGVIWEDHKTRSLVSMRNFEQATGYKNHFDFVEAKAMTGDASDNISGVGQVGEVKAKLILQIWGNTEMFFLDKNPSETWSVSQTGKFPKAISEFHSDPDKRKKYEQNLKLMTLYRLTCLPKPDDLQITKQELDLEDFREVCKELGFHSILKDFDNFVDPFKLHRRKE